jgi:hypothetical protein
MVDEEREFGLAPNGSLNQVLFPAIALIPGFESARSGSSCNDHFDRNNSRYGLFFSDCGRVAAERKER